MPYFWLYNIEEILWRDRKFKIRSIESNHQKMIWNKNPKGFELFASSSLVILSDTPTYQSAPSLGYEISLHRSRVPPKVSLHSTEHLVTSGYRHLLWRLFPKCYFPLTGAAWLGPFMYFFVPSLKVPSHPRRLWDCWSATLSHCWFNLASRRWFIINACSEMSEWDFMEYLAGSMND